MLILTKLLGICKSIGNRPSKSQKHNPNYLSSVEFDTTKLKLTSDINEAVAYADYIIFAIPSAFLSAELEKLTVSLQDKVIFCNQRNCTETFLIVGNISINNTIFHLKIFVITGPCHAEEVALERLSYLTIACGDSEKAKVVAKVLAGNYIKTKISDDIIGLNTQQC